MNLPLLVVAESYRLAWSWARKAGVPKSRWRYAGHHGEWLSDAVRPWVVIQPGWDEKVHPDRVTVIHRRLRQADVQVIDHNDPETLRPWTDTAAGPGSLSQT